MIEGSGSGSGSIPLTNGSGSRFGRSKNMGNTALCNSRSNAEEVIFQTPGEVESMRHALVPFVQKNVVARSAFSSWALNVLSSSPFFVTRSDGNHTSIFLLPKCKLLELSYSALAFTSLPRCLYVK